MKKILFLCIHNSARSQMAEAFTKRLFSNIFEVYSAGTDPSIVNKTAIKVMNEVGIDISTYKSKSANEFIDQEFDFVITVCDQAKESCPIFHKAKKILHQSFEDPSAFEGDEEERIKRFRKVRDEIKEYINKLPSLLTN